MSKPFERKFNAGALLLAAVAAPTIALWLFMVVGAIVGRGTLNGAGSSLPYFFFLTLLITVWGLIPAGAFGALGLVMLQRLSAGRSPPSWVFAVSGAGAASVYVTTALALTRWAEPVAVLVAPWAVFLRPGGNVAPAPDLSGVVAAIVVAGSVAGLIYERSSRAAPPETVRPALFLSDDEQG